MWVRDMGSAIASRFGIRRRSAGGQAIDFRGFAVLAFSVCVLGASAQVTSPVTLQGPIVCEDSTLYSNATSDNAGGGDINRAGSTGSAGNRRLIIRFDVSSIPSNATINSVTLAMFCTNVPSGATATTQDLHRVTNTWVEGTGLGAGTGGQIVAGAVTWASREHSSVPWTSAGGDFDTTSSAALNVGSTTGSKSWAGSGLVADVQAWVNGSQPNNGWILIGNESAGNTARGYGSAENFSTSNQPALVVDFSAPVTAVNRWSRFE